MSNVIRITRLRQRLHVRRFLLRVQWCAVFVQFSGSFFYSGLRQLWRTLRAGTNKLMYEANDEKG